MTYIIAITITVPLLAIMTVFLVLTIETWNQHWDWKTPSATFAIIAALLVLLVWLVNDFTGRGSEAPDGAAISSTEKDKQ